MAHTPLLTAAEFDDQVAPSDAFSKVATTTKDRALRWASIVALGFVQKRKVLPLVSWGDDLREAVGDLAAFKMMGKRGYSPNAGSNGTIRQAYDDAMAWLLQVSKGLTELVDCVDSTTTPIVDEAGPLMASDAIVNWNYQTRQRFFRGGGDGLG